MDDITCSIAGCDGRVLARAWCAKHYRRWARNGDPLTRSAEDKPACAVVSCSRGGPIVKGLCPTHLQRKRRGLPLEVVRRCGVCTVIFVPANIGAIYCSKKCSRDGSRWSTDLVCEEPGCDRVHAARGMCSMHWRRWARATGRESPEPWNEKRRARWKARYALSRGADGAESFDYREVYERDGWVCGICGDPVDREAVWPDPLSVSLDHVVPVSRGGEHTRENSQCAHLVCNLRKGDSVQVGAMSA